jgi:AraC-like DNA-binding protein
MARYHGVLNTGSLWKQTKEGTHVALTFEIQAGPPLATRGAVEYALAEAVHFSTLVTGRPVPIIEVRIPHAAPPDDGPYRRHFKAPIRWKAAVASLVLAPAALQIGLLKADPHLRAYFEARADALAQRHASEEELSARIRQLVIAALPSGLPVLDRLARKVGLSARSLRRHLAAEGTSFQELVEETRSELSRQYLRDSRLNISEIAFMLGFSDLSPFQRAFRRWNNVTPRTFRERALARPPAVPRSGAADADSGQPLGR